MNGSCFLSIRRHLSMPTWWPFQENLFGLHHLRRLQLLRCQQHVPEIPSHFRASLPSVTHRLDHLRSLTAPTIRRVPSKFLPPSFPQKREPSVLFLSDRIATHAFQRATQCSSNHQTATDA
jgi:hypothetical protein